MLRLFLAALFCLVPATLFARDDVPAGKEVPAVKEAPAKTVREFATRLQSRYAYGLYVKDKKIGWEIQDFKIDKYEGKDVLLMSTESYLAITVDGEKSVSEEKTVTRYSLEGEGDLVQAEVRVVEDGKTTVRQAVRKGKGMALTTKQNARNLTREIPMPKDNVASDMRFAAWLNEAERKKGDRFTKYALALDEDDVDKKEVYTFLKKEERALAGVATMIYFVESESKGAREKAQLLPDGRILTATLAGIVTQKLEKEATVKKLDGGEVDLMAATSIVVDTDLGRGGDVEKLTLEVTGLGDFRFPASHRQVVKPGKESTTLELSRDFKVEKEVPLKEEERKENLKATASIQCDHEDIQKLAKRIVGDEKDPVKAAARIERWVYRNLKKSYSDNADNALAVLDHKAGDCTEHALLFVALARAAGIPAREVGGVAFIKLSKPVFGWHAWAEIHDGRQWVSVDPTWNQVMVDATHIKLQEGSQDNGWLNLVGKMKIKVVKFEKKKKK